MKHIIFLCLLCTATVPLSGQTFTHIWNTPTLSYELVDTGSKLAGLRSKSILLYSKEGILTDSLPINLGFNISDFCYHKQQHAFFISGSPANTSDSAFIVKISISGVLEWKKRYKKSGASFSEILSISPDSSSLVCSYFYIKGSTNGISCFKLDGYNGTLIYESETIVAPSSLHKPVARVEAGPGGDVFALRARLNGEAPYRLIRFDGQTGLMKWTLDLEGDYTPLFRLDPNGYSYFIFSDNRLVKVSPDGAVIYEKQLGYYYNFTASLSFRGDKLMLLGTWAYEKSIQFLPPCDGAAVRIVDAMTGDSLFEVRVQKDMPPDNVYFTSGVWESDSTFYSIYYIIYTSDRLIGKFSISDQSISSTTDQDEKPSAKMIITPNPAISDRVTVTTPFNEGKLVLYHTSGATILTTDIHQYSNQITVPDQPGIYWLVGISSSGQSVTERIVR